MLQASTGISRGPWPIVIGAVWDARGTEEIARALKGVDSDLEILQRRRPWAAVACERHGKLQSAYSDDPHRTTGGETALCQPPKGRPWGVALGYKRTGVARGAPVLSACTPSLGSC